MFEKIKGKKLVFKKEAKENGDLFATIKPKEISVEPEDKTVDDEEEKVREKKKVKEEQKKEKQKK